MISQKPLTSTTKSDKVDTMDLEKLDAVCYVFAHCQMQIHLLNDYTSAQFLFYDEWSDNWDRLEEIYEGEIEPTDEDVTLVNELYDTAVRLELVDEIADMLEK
jgi:hypothetical protein